MWGLQLRATFISPGVKLADDFPEFAARGCTFFSLFSGFNQVHTDVHTAHTRKQHLFSAGQARIVRAPACRFCAAADSDLSTLPAPSPSRLAGVPGLYTRARCQVCFPTFTGAELAVQIFSTLLFPVKSVRDA